MQTLPSLHDSYVPEGPVQAGTNIHVATYICMYKRSPPDIKTPKQRNLTGCSMTTSLPLLSPSSILPPPSLYAFPQGKIPHAFEKYDYFYLFTFSKIT
jgi:hypothetical protein